MRYIKYIAFTIIACAALVSCGFSGTYSLSGSSISPDWKTLYIPQFPNNAPLQNPSLSQELTLTLQDAFRNRTKLDLTTDENADLTIEGEITGYDVVPLSIQGNDIAAQNRLTITIKVRYINRIDESKSFDRSFTAYENFPGTQTLADVESTIVPNIVDLIRDQVFAAIAMDW